MKVYEAVVKKGKIVPSEPLDLPDGTLVHIMPETVGEGFGVSVPDPFDNIEELAIETGIRDFAEEHDHYLYGIPKRREGRNRR